VVGEIEAYGGHAMLAQADVSDRAQVTRVFAEITERFGPVDILVNSAVRDYFASPFLELTWDDMARDLDVIVQGAFHCCQTALPMMMKKRAGKIINVASIAVENPPAGQAKYVTAKSALVGLTRSLAVEFASHNVQVNLVVPSIVETDLSRLVPKMFLDKLKNETPMKRGALPEDVARAIVFLASSLSDFTTGQKIMVTGGNAPFL
jgi:3-oxoacyl-[acyl-carrier protein] reductase